MMTGKPSLDQRRAAHAWKAVERAKKHRGAADYAREAKRLPVRIKTAGLGQSLAFIRAKARDGENAKAQLLIDLGKWVLHERRMAGPRSGDIDERSLIHEITKGDSGLLRYLTEEALLYLGWLTRFAEAEIGGDDQEV